MSLFIQVENQNILWEMVNKIPLCNTVFPPSNPSSQNNKSSWFRSIIEEYYNKIPPNISRNDLYQINRDVLSNMMKNLLALSNNNAPQNMIDRGMFSRLESPIETKKTDFEIRQSQYKAMFEVQKPGPIDFSEKLDDDVITNMNELIENQRKMRELELQQFAPKQIDTLQNIKVNILEDIPKESIPLQKLPEQKHVRFDLSEEDFINQSGSESIEIKQQMENMNKKIENMDEKINKIFEMLTTITNPVLSNNTIEVLENEKKDNVDNIKHIMDSNE